jgi:hypothetical protein
MSAHISKRMGRFQRFKLRGISTQWAAPKAYLDAVVGFLNDPKAPGRGKIIRVLSEMLAIEKMPTPIFDGAKLGVPPDELLIRTTRTGKEVPHPKIRGSHEWKEHSAREKRIGALNRELAEYKFQAQMLPMWIGPPNFWHTVWGLESRREERRGGQGLSEAQVIQTIFNLASAGYLNRLRQCGHCQKWLYASKISQKFCSFKCQQKQYTQSEAWKEHRRRYMRQYNRVKGFCR